MNPELCPGCSHLFHLKACKVCDCALRDGGLPQPRKQSVGATTAFGSETSIAHIRGGAVIDQRDLNAPLMVRFIAWLRRSVRTRPQ